MGRREHFKSTSAAEEERRSLRVDDSGNPTSLPFLDASIARRIAQRVSRPFIRARASPILCIGSPPPCKTTRLGRPLNKNPSARAPVDERGGSLQTSDRPRPIGRRARDHRHRWDEDDRLTPRKNAKLRGGAHTTHTTRTTNTDKQRERKNLPRW